MASNAVRSATLLALATHVDERGSLSVGEELPFLPQRFFVVRDVPPGHVRAEHANRTCHEVLVCTQGGCTVEVDDGMSIETFRLEGPGAALDVPAGLWLRCRDFTPDAALLVLAELPYDPADQITDYAEFCALR